MTLTQYLGMMVRKVPIAKIKRGLALCDAAGVTITSSDLETHFLCGKDPVALAEALVMAKQLGVETTFQEMSSILLAGHDAKPLLLGATEDRVEEFNTFSPTRDDQIKGFAKDGTEVSASIRVVYRLSIGQLAFAFNFRPTHERLGAAVSVYINTSPDKQSLEIGRDQHEAELKAMVIQSIPGLREVAITYS